MRTMTKSRFIRQNANFLKNIASVPNEGQTCGYKVASCKCSPPRGAACGCLSGLLDCECEVLKKQFGSEGPPEG